MAEKKGPGWGLEPPSRPSKEAMRKKPIWFRRDGKPIHDVLTWAKLFENLAYKRVAETLLEDGTRISTVWLGLNHNFSENEPPLIFETMVFSCEPQAFPEEWDCRRYSTEAEAIMGHDAMTRKWKGIRERWKNLEVRENVGQKSAPRGPHSDRN